MSTISEETQQATAKRVAKRRPETSVSLDTTRLRKMITKLMDNLEKDDISSKGSVGDLLKLLQVYKELTAEQVKEVEVRWVDRLRVDDERGT